MDRIKKAETLSGIGEISALPPIVEAGYGVIRRIVPGIPAMAPANLAFCAS